MHAADGEEIERASTRLEAVKHAGDRAINLTRQLLAFSRQQMLEPRVLDLNQIRANSFRYSRRSSRT